MSLPNPSEKNWIRRARRGDDEAFEQLVVHYSVALYRVISRITEDTSEAENIVQEAFLRFWQVLPRYLEDQPLFPYLVTIALNLRRDQWRKSRFLDYSDLDEIDTQLNTTEKRPETQVEEAELLQALAEAVTELPLAYRTVIALRYEGGMNYQEIANVLDIPLNTVRTHLRRAKANLQQMLERKYYG